ncbi:MAG: DUF2214 family protein [Chloroflexota bacterium]
MTTDALLAIAHHLAVFSLVSLLVVELVLMRGPLGADTIGRFSRIDALYGIAAIAVVAAGIARVAWGLIPADFYLGNLFFWVKMGTLAAIAILSIDPTVRSARWRRAVAADPGWTAPEAEIRRARRIIHVELALLPLIPISAVLMARGIGAL